MIINNKKAIYDFKSSHPDAKNQLDAWEIEVEAAKWKNPNELRQHYAQVSILKAKNAIFNIHSGKYRLWVTISYKLGIILIRKIGTHREYDKWDIR